MENRPRRLRRVRRVEVAGTKKTEVERDRKGDGVTRVGRDDELGRIRSNLPKDVSLQLFAAETYVTPQPPWDTCFVVVGGRGYRTGGYFSKIFNYNAGSPLRKRTVYVTVDGNLRLVPRRLLSRAKRLARATTFPRDRRRVSAYRFLC